MPGLAQQPHHLVATPDTLKWVDPPTLPPGAKLALVKVPANYKIPPHFHKAGENVTVLSGAFFIGLGEKFDQGSSKELGPGAFVSIPAKHPHFAWAGSQETVIQVHGFGPTDITFVNPTDDPRKK